MLLPPFLAAATSASYRHTPSCLGVLELILLCELRELLTLVLCFIGAHLLDKLISDVPLDEVVVFIGCPPFLHVLSVEFRPEVAKRFAY
jgi:hypothetical protein